MSLLSSPAIALLARLPSIWTDVDALELDGAEPALLELRRDRLAEVQVYPPPNPDLYRRAAKERDLAIPRRWQVRRTPRGALRLQRITEGRRRVA
jgi:hypothetical protein